MDLLALSPLQWALAGLAAYMIGLSKSGLSGLGMVTVVLMAVVMRGHEMASTGVVLPLLICGDLMAVRAFRAHVVWRHVLRILPPALVGVVIGYWIMQVISNVSFKPLIGWIVLVLTLLQVARQRFPGSFRQVPHHPAFAWFMGGGAGVTTMMANAAGPIMSLYLLAVELPKMQLVGTAAWYFLLVNLMKVPFSVNLGLIHPQSLLFNAILVPLVAIGILSGRWVIHRINQRLFEQLLLWFAAVSAIYLILF